MSAQVTFPLPYWPIALYFAGVVVLVGGMIGLSFLLGERNRSQRATDDPYEGGIVPTGTARLRLSAKFYLIAMFFVIFDLETAFVFAWALVVRETGWLGYGQICVFIGVLIAALVYLWRLGALDWWGAGGRKLSK